MVLSFATLTIRSFAALVTIALLYPCQEAFGQLRDSFEGNQLAWQLWSSDASARVALHERSTLLPHSGQASEVVELACQTGTNAFLAYPLQPPLGIIEELRASVWIRSAPSGMKIAFRVVFPRTAHPTTGNPLTTLLFGSSSTGRGEWSMLQVSDPITLLARQQRVLRQQYGPMVDLRNAFVDAIVIDAYAGPGNTKLQIDDLVVEGMVEAAAVAPLPSVLPIEGESPDTQTHVAIEVGQRMNDIRRSVPRWLDYRGESPAWLRSIGITGIVLNTAPDPALLEEARRQELHVLAPPPTTMPAPEQWDAYEAVQGWLLGSALDASAIEPTRQLGQRLSRMPVALMRPTMVEAMEDYWKYSRLSDLLAFPVPIPSTVRGSDEMIQILLANRREARGQSAGLASLGTQSPVEWVEQSRSIAKSINAMGTEDFELDMLQSRMQVYRSIAAGVGGWYFRSDGPLDSGQRADQLRSIALQSSCREVEWLAPWILAPDPPKSLALPSSLPYRGTVHALPNSSLVLLIAQGDFDQMCAVPPSDAALPLTIPYPGVPTQVLRISGGRLEPLSAKQTPGGMQVTIGQPGFVEMLVLSADTRTMAFLRQRSLETTTAMIENRSEIAAQVTQLAQRTLVSQRIRSGDALWQQVRNAESQMRSAGYFLQRNDQHAAIEAFERATILAQQVVRGNWTEAVRQVGQPQNSPVLVSSLGLPLHWDLTHELSERTWSTIDIPAGSFDNLDEMQASGWTQNRRLEDTLDVQIGVEPRSGPDGGGSLRVSGQSLRGTAIPGGYAGSSLRIRSPAIAVPQGAMVRIDAIVQVRRCLAKPQAGLLVYDNLAGPAMGRLYDQPSSPDTPWQRVTLYRSMADQDPLRIMMELRGEGEFLVDQLSVSYLVPGTESRYLVPYRPQEPRSASR
jgi:hypothetical protein